jgi:hypothetical protein
MRGCIERGRVVAGIPLANGPDRPHFTAPKRTVKAHPCAAVVHARAMSGRYGLNDLDRGMPMTGARKPHKGGKLFILLGC